VIGGVKVGMESGKLARKVVIEVGRWWRREGEKRKGKRVAEGGGRRKRKVVVNEMGMEEK